jgi:hypothetical protein
MSRVSEDWETVGDLLIECVTTDAGPDSFVGRYKGALTHEAFLNEFNVKFGFNIAKVFTGEAGAKIGTRDPLAKVQMNEVLNTSERIKRRIFQSFVDRARESDDAPNVRIIFFVDEMDRKPKLPGLGAAVKDINDVQFCFIGIADTIDDIIAEHESAGRKLTGGGVKIPELSDSEIEWIFDNAEHMSSNSVSFSREFRARVVEYAEGMPWIAQHVGYEAVFPALREARRRKEKKLLIDTDVFRPAMKAAIELYRKTFNERYDIEKSMDDAGLTGQEMLKVLLKNKLPMSDTDIKNGLPADQQRLKRWIPNTLTKFISTGIIVEKEKRFAFPNALLRIFTRYHIDEMEECGRK